MDLSRTPGPRPPLRGGWPAAGALVFSLVLAAAPAAAATAAAAPLSLTFDADPESPHFGTVAAGPLAPELLAAAGARSPTAAEWRTVLAVYTGGEPPADGRPAVVGSWTLDGDLLRFRPRYPLVAGLDYVARFDLGRLEALASREATGGEPMIATFSLPEEEAEPTTVVTEVYPTASELPENQLRFYVHFSAPMSRGEAYRHLRLVDGATGEAAEAPFLEITEELWDPGMRRLTLFFDPGRIKRGLRPHLEAGPPLREGATYRLVVDPAWRDARGVPLAAGFAKSFTVAAPDRRAPDPAEWQVTAPAAGTLEPFELRFPEPLDHGLLARVVRVRDAGGALVGGRVEIGDGETLFRWWPEEPWTAGAYRLEAETLLEDLAGNNLEKVFDVDLAAGAHAGPDQETIAIPWTAEAR